MFLFLAYFIFTKDPFGFFDLQSKKLWRINMALFLQTKKPSTNKYDTKIEGLPEWWF